MKEIVILGASGFAREVAWLIEEINKSNKEWNLLGFVDNDEKLIGKNINGYKVIGNDEWLLKQELFIINGIGNPSIKEKAVSKFKDTNNKFATLIHPNVVYSDSVEIGEGTIICAGNIITVNVNLGNHVTINLDCTIGHDVDIDHFATILPSVNISGNVKIGKSVTVGTGSAIIEERSIGEYSIIGAQSTVVKNIPSNCTAVGTPAKPIKFHK